MVGFLRGNGDMIRVTVSPPQSQHVRSPQPRIATKQKHILGRLELLSLKLVLLKPPQFIPCQIHNLPCQPSGSLHLGAIVSVGGTLVYFFPPTPLQETFEPRQIIVYRNPLLASVVHKPSVECLDISLIDVDQCHIWAKLPQQMSERLHGTQRPRRPIAFPVQYILSERRQNRHRCRRLHHILRCRTLGQLCSLGKRPSQLLRCGYNMQAVVMAKNVRHHLRPLSHQRVRLRRRLRPPLGTSQQRVPLRLGKRQPRGKRHRLPAPGRDPHLKVLPRRVLPPVEDKADGVCFVYHLLCSSNNAVYFSNNVKYFSFQFSLSNSVSGSAATVTTSAAGSPGLISTNILPFPVNSQ